MTMKSPFASYAETQRAGLTGRALEAAVLIKAAQRLDTLRRALDDQEAPDTGALINNRRLWEILLLSATDASNPLPYDTKRAIANIGIFVLSHTFDQLAQPTRKGLTALIDINRALAEGLSAKPATIASATAHR
jgi:flagellar protein FlaF